MSIRKQKVKIQVGLRWNERKWYLVNFNSLHPHVVRENVIKYWARMLVNKLKRGVKNK